MIAAALVAFQIFIFGGQQDAYWDWQLTSPYDLDIKVQVLALDPIDHHLEDIIELRKRGVKTICYISIGTWEEYRADADQFPEAVLGKQPGRWPEERYLDVRQLDKLLPIMEARVQECADKGFQAIEMDNMDVSDNDTGFPIKQREAVTYLRAIAEMARTRGLEVAQKNAPGLIEELVDEMDFIIVESCYKWEWCHMTAPYLAQGKDVLAVEYEPEDLDWEAICEDAKRRGIHLLLKQYEVTAGGKACK